MRSIKSCWGGLGSSSRPVGRVFQGKGVGLLEGSDVVEGSNRVWKPKSRNGIDVSGGPRMIVPMHMTEPPLTQIVLPALGESSGGASEPMSLLEEEEGENSNPIEFVAALQAPEMEKGGIFGE